MSKLKKIIEPFNVVKGFKETSKLFKERKEELYLKKAAGMAFYVTYKHIFGLPVAENTRCIYEQYEDGIKFNVTGSEFSLDLNKVQDITATKDIKHIGSSIGGAIGGAMLAGTFGAMFGGRNKKKTITYLVITYNNDNELKYIILEMSELKSLGEAFPTQPITFFNQYKKNNGIKTKKIEL